MLFRSVPRRRQESSSRRDWRLELLEIRQVLSASGFDESAAMFDGSQILVKFRDAAEPEPLKGTSLGESYGLVPGLFTINVDADLDVDDVLAAYEARADVEYAQYDFRIQVAATPNDPRYASQWGLHNIGQTGGLTDADIDAPEAWDRTTGSRSIIVGVIDTGIDYNHPDLAANIWRNTREIAGNGLDDDGNGYRDDTRGWDFRNNDADPFDDNSHGTHVAGIIGAVGNNAVGIAGVAWNVQLMPLKFLGADGSGSTSAAISAINYAVANGAKILNNSWGGGGASTALNDAVARARAAGVIFVAAAGNEANNNDTNPAYPANVPLDNVISVAATDSSDRLASFSNFGATTVDIAAPGVAILSTTPKNTYSSYSGTSMATPFVSGAAALLWSANPTLTYAQVISRLYSSADVVGNLAGKVTGARRLNIARALADSSTPADTVAPRVTGATFSGDATGISGATVNFSEAVQLSTITSSSLRLLGPGGQAIPLSSVLASNGNTTFTLNFARQTTAGIYTLVVEPTVKDVAGNLLNQDGDGTFGETTQDRFTATQTVSGTTTATFTTTAAQSIRDLGTITVPLTISSNLRISDVNIRVNLTHTYTSDLVITAIHPDGTRVTLFNRRGGAGDNLTNTLFDDEASTAISAGRAPFTGSFRPDSLLSAFDGKLTAGTWQLEIRDLARADTGAFQGFSVIVTGVPVVAGTTIRETAPVTTPVTSPVTTPPAAVQPAFRPQAATSAEPAPAPVSTFSTLASLVQAGSPSAAFVSSAHPPTNDSPAAVVAAGTTTARDLDYLFASLGANPDEAWDAPAF